LTCSQNGPRYEIKNTPTPEVTNDLFGSSLRSAKKFRSPVATAEADFSAARNRYEKPAARNGQAATFSRAASYFKTNLRCL
jgi:hypothetical protein